MEQTFRALQKHWEVAEFHHTRFLITVQQQQSPPLGDVKEKNHFISHFSPQNAPNHHISDGGTFTIIGKLYRHPYIQLISMINTDQIQLHTYNFLSFSSLFRLGLETLLAQTKESVLTFSDMLRSPHVAEFQKEVEHWLLLLQKLGIFVRSP